MSSRPMMISAIHGDDAVDRQQRDQHAGDEQLVGGRVEERAELRRDVPAAREAAVDPVGRRGDAEQRGGGPGVGAVGEQQRHHDRREDDAQRTCPRRGTAQSGPLALTCAAPRAERGRQPQRPRRAPRPPRASSAASACARGRRARAASTRAQRLLHVRDRGRRPCSARSRRGRRAAPRPRGSPASSPHTPTQRPCASAPRRPPAISRSTARLRAGEQRRRARSLPRSAAIVYWARSFVPIEKKSTCARSARRRARPPAPRP